ncbi:MAG: hypothetical protein CBC42_00875 [Betaproteobacteria bacterium TMED82]|nr:MAG: hypothetical protein CBC42_00875 [Betaproteobacteria bacterium TMED82]
MIFQVKYKIQKYGFFTGLIIFCLIYFLPNPEGLSVNGQITLAVFLLMGIWWATEALPLPITSLLPLILFPIFAVEQIGVVSKEFMNKVQFLFAGGFMIAIAMQKWNLHKRIALTILQFTGVNSKNIIAGFMLTSALLSMWVMNTSTTIMLLPIGVSIINAVSDTLKDVSPEEKSNFQICLLLGVAYASSAGGIATPIGTSPNGYLIQFMGEKGFDIGFFDWLMIGLPVTLVLVPIIWFFLTFFLFPVSFTAPAKTKQIIKTMLRDLGPMSYEEKLVGAVFLITAFLWMTRKLLAEIPMFVMLEDAVIAMMGGMILCLLSSKFNESKLLTWKDLEAKFPWGLIFLFGGGMALAYVVNTSGLAVWLAGLIPTQMSVFFVIVILVGMIIFLTELTSNLATTMTFIPIVYAIGLKVGVNPLILVVPLTISASCAFMLPVATPPNSIVYASNLIPIEAMVRAGLILNIIAVGLVVLLTYFLVPLRF